MQKSKCLHAVPVLRVFVLCNANIDFAAVLLLNHAIPQHALRANNGVVVVNSELFVALKLARVGIPVNNTFPAYTFQHIPQLETGH